MIIQVLFLLGFFPQKSQNPKLKQQVREWVEYRLIKTACTVQTGKQLNAYVLVSARRADIPGNFSGQDEAETGMLSDNMSRFLQKRWLKVLFRNESLFHDFQGVLENDIFTYCTSNGLHELAFWWSLLKFQDLFNEVQLRVTNNKAVISCTSVSLLTSCQLAAHHPFWPTS